MHDTISTSTLAVSEAIPKSGTALPVVATRPVRRGPTLVRGAALLACFESVAAVTAILVVLIQVSLPAVSGNLDGLLSARITVKNVLLLILLAGAWPGLFHLFGLYDASHVRRFRSEAQRLLAAVTAGTALALVFPMTSISGTMTAGHLPYFWVISLALCLGIRVARRTADRAQRRQERRTLIVGTGPLARRAYKDLTADRPHRHEFVGFVDDSVGDGPKSDNILQEPLGTLEQLEHILMHLVVDEVVIALPIKSRYQQIQYAISVCERAGVHAKYGADLFQSTVGFQKYDAQGGRAFVALHVTPDDDRLVVKRIIDVAGAIVGLAILSPLMAIVAIGIKLTSRGPVIYAQERCGLNKRPFRMYKFRSMFADAEANQPGLEGRNEANGPVFKIRHDPRITPLGRLLRKSSLDELPQLWNVLRGDMSLVGPRPLPWRDVRRITLPSVMRRASMRPGLTCLWQVEGRNNLDFDRWVALDLEYIDSWSLVLDFRILLKTIPAVLSGNGAE